MRDRSTAPYPANAVALLALLAAAPALAQSTPSPQQLNACTAIADPVALRTCLERNAGVEERVPEARPARRESGPILRDEGVFNERERAPRPSLLQDGGVADRAAGPPP